MKQRWFVRGYLAGLAVWILYSVITAFMPQAETYLMKGYVSSVNEETGRFEVVNYTCSHVPYGNIWAFDDAEDLFAGDVVVMMMNDRGTEGFEDDICVELMYAGCNVSQQL